MSSPKPTPRDAGLDLALAVVGAAAAPMVLLDGGLSVVAASASFCAAFQIAPETVEGSLLANLGHGEWGGRKLASLLAATSSGAASIDAYEMDLLRPGREPRHLIIHANKLEYGDHANVRLLLAIADVTDARNTERLKDQLVREKDVLMQEIQHRVANSLQIIASVLLQSAKRVGGETRTHLIDAHQRVMSIAALQKQLAVSHMGDIELSAYFSSLCRSIGASMIRDHELVTLEVVADDATTSPDISVSLGLIVTELVINALKHAFPENRPGKITVTYRAKGGDWTLSVDDNGVGIAGGAAGTVSGLGTGIVRALAGQLKARIVVTDNKPGTGVSVIHIAAIDGVENAATPVPESVV